MQKLDLEGLKRLPKDDHWPPTHYTIYSNGLEQGDAGKRQCSIHVMTVYRDSLIKFYRSCSGSTDFPRIPKRDSYLSDEDHAADVVHDYFAKRSENLIIKWARSREQAAPGSPQHLRGFIKQDFRYHCLEMLRQDLRFHRRARELTPEALPTTPPPADVQRETTRLELTGLVRMAIDIALEVHSPAERTELRVLAENRFLHERRYSEFVSQLSCGIEAARKKASRLKDRLLPILRDLIRAQGDSIAELREDLQ